MCNCHQEIVCFALMILGVSSSYLWAAWRDKIYQGLGLSFLICSGSVGVFRFTAFMSIFAFAILFAGCFATLLYLKRVSDRKIVHGDVEYPDYCLCFSLVYIAALIVYFFRHEVW